MLKQFGILIFSAVLFAGCASSFNQVQRNPYEVVSCGSSTDTVVFIKFSTLTGQAWILSDEWIPIEDEIKLPESKYSIKIVSMPGHIYTAVRINTVTGQSWSSINNRWIEISSKREKDSSIKGGLNE